jgi:hypothetical protein
LSNGSAIVLGSVVIGVGIAISGVVTKIGAHTLSHDKMSVCWQHGLTSGLDDLAKQVALPRFKDALPASMSSQDRAGVIQSFSVSLSNREFTGESGHWGTVKCDATIAYSYTRPDGTTHTVDKGNVVAYTMHPAKSGWGYEMNGASIPMLLISYTDQ